MKYDIVIFGGGTSGISCAYIAAKKGLKTLLVEKSDVLGGAITQGLVVPCMKIDSLDINVEFLSDLKAYAKRYNASYTYIDANDAWFNPELLKIVFDDMLHSVNCSVLFSTIPQYIKRDSCFRIELNHKMLSLYIESEYIVDTTSNAEIFKLLNFDLQKDTEKQQATTLRFILSNIDLNCFSKWITKLDRNKDVTTVDYSSEQINLSTAYTWDKSKNWALAPIFTEAVKNGDLEYEDTAYFQVFSIHSMPNSLAFNCPRIILNEYENILDPFVYSRALKQGRERIFRLYHFCKKYLPGFENCFISHISDILGVRESYRIKGKYTLTKEDIINNKKFENVAFASNYPIDIHSNNKEDKLEFTNHTYLVPIETLISEQDDKVYAAGRIISTDFEAQAAVRTQINCFSMGEAVAKDISRNITKKNSNKSSSLIN